MDRRSIAAEVRLARVGAGLTQGELARRTGTTQSAVSRMESGRVTPSLAALARVAAAVGRPITIVVGAPGAPRPPAAAPAPAAAVEPAGGASRGRPVPSAATARGR